MADTKFTPPGFLIGKQNRGKDFNFFLEVAVTNADFAESPDVVIGFRGPRRMMIICPSGSVDYSFDGNNLHGKTVSGEPSEKLEFDVRMEDKVWFRGTGTVQFHAWHIGV